MRFEDDLEELEFPKDPSAVPAKAIGLDKYGIYDRPYSSSQFSKPYTTPFALSTNYNPAYEKKNDIDQILNRERSRPPDVYYSSNLPRDDYKFGAQYKERAGERPGERDLYPSHSPVYGENRYNDRYENKYEPRYEPRYENYPQRGPNVEKVNNQPGGPLSMLPPI